MRTNNNLLVSVVLAVLLTAVPVVCTLLLIRNLGVVILTITGDETFARIFGQLHAAFILPPFFLPLGLWFVFFRIRAGKSAVRTVLFAIPLGLALFIYVLYFTRVNGIWFGDVMVSLARFASRGLFDGL